MYWNHSKNFNNQCHYSFELKASETHYLPCLYLHFKALRVRAVVNGRGCGVSSLVYDYLKKYNGVEVVCKKGIEEGELMLIMMNKENYEKSTVSHLIYFSFPVEIVNKTPEVLLLGFLYNENGSETQDYMNKYRI